MSKKEKLIRPNTERIKTFNDIDWNSLDEVDFDFDPKNFMKMTKVSQASSSSLIHEAEAMDHGGPSDMKTSCASGMDGGGCGMGDPDMDSGDMGSPCAGGCGGEGGPGCSGAGSVGCQGM